MNDSKFINYDITNSELGFAAEEIKKMTQSTEAVPEANFRKFKKRSWKACVSIWNFFWH